ncbi:hypothetical protein AX16_010890 [Volvariella volvacea WC 439]|nr:hypothetical protein AX16_010890 [Volvariella volvacea WC 439]
MLELPSLPRHAASPPPYIIHVHIRINLNVHHLRPSSSATPPPAPAPLPVHIELVQKQDRADDHGARARDTPARPAVCEKVQARAGHSPSGSAAWIRRTRSDAWAGADTGAGAGAEWCGRCGWGCGWWTAAPGVEEAEESVGRFGGRWEWGRKCKRKCKCKCQYQR